MTNLMTSSSATGTGSLYVSGTTAGTEYLWNNATVSVDSPDESSTPKKRIGPKLYFNYVKSKLTKIELGKLQQRIGTMQKLLEGAAELGQSALYEHAADKILEAVKESEIVACGVEKWLIKENITKYIGYVSWAGYDDRICFLKKLEEFPRPIPPHIKTKISSIKRKKIFDELWILYLDYTGDKEEIKSNKEKIKEKDPILFGKCKDVDKYYFIIDWIDHVCDLTFNEIVKNQCVDPQKIPKMDKAFILNLKLEIAEQKKRLEKTRPSNYKDLMDEETGPKKKKAWWKFWK